jgi:hypothetical protein
MGDASLRFGCAPCTKHSSFPLYGALSRWFSARVGSGSAAMPVSKQAGRLFSLDRTHCYEAGLVNEKKRGRSALK